MSTTKLAAAHSIPRSKIRPIVVPPTKSTVFTKFVGRLRIAPQQQARLSLGIYGTGRREKGFSVELKPASKSDDSVDTHIFSIGSDQRHELVLSVDNHGNRAVTADVWQM